MTNALVLPSFLSALAGIDLGASIRGGISGGNPIHNISIKGSRFRLQYPNDEEQVVGINLEVIIVGANNHVSKSYYASAYNPADTDFKAPTCFSDNGVGPSAQATTPQCVTCAACPHNVWGSKVTSSGSETRACADIKKIAVVLADNPTGPVFLLRVPAASLKNLYAYIEALDTRKIPVAGIRTMLSFDSKVDYPKISFAATGYVDESQFHAVKAVIGSDEVNKLVGNTDTVHSAPVAVAAAPVAQAVAAQVQVASQSNPFAGLIPEVEVKATRTRKPKIAQEENTAQSSVVETTGFMASVRASAADRAEIAPKVATPDLDALLNDLMKS